MKSIKYIQSSFLQHSQNERIKKNPPYRWWVLWRLQLVVNKTNPYYSLYHHRCWNLEAVLLADTSSGLSCWYQKNGHTYGKKYHLGLFHYINVSKPFSCSWCFFLIVLSSILKILQTHFGYTIIGLPTINCLLFKV